MKPLNDPPRAKLVPDAEADAFLKESARRGRVEEVNRAKCFSRIDAGNHFLLEGCASVAEYGARIGFGSNQARDYTAAGHVMSVCPMAEQWVLDRSMTISALAIIAPYFLEPGMRPVDENGEPLTDLAIYEWARLLPDRDLLRAVKKRRRDVETGETTVRKTLDLTQQGVEDLARTQVLEGRKKRRTVSESEAAETALRDYVEKYDLLAKTPRARRVPDMPEKTDGTKNPRSVPAEVKRELMARHDDMCAIGYCENHIFLENSHHTPHAEGGGNESEHQDRICSLHHRMKDHGEIAWVPSADEPSGGHYETREGRVTHLKPIGPPGEPRGDPPGEPPRDDRVREPPVRFIASRFQGSHFQGSHFQGSHFQGSRSRAQGSPDCLPLPGSLARSNGRDDRRASRSRRRPYGRKRASPNPSAGVRPWKRPATVPTSTASVSGPA